MAIIKIKALTKLLDYTASGIGAVAGTMLAPWKASQEAEAKRITAQADADAQITKAEADASSLQIIADAQAKARQSLDAPIESGHGTLEINRDGVQQRIEFQERKRQSNIVSVVRAAATELGDKEVPNHEPDPDWTARFFDCVQDVSSEEMQKIWAKILSGEVENPGRTSLRTLDTLRNMTKRDAEMFSDVCSFVFNEEICFIFYERKYTQSYEILQHSRLLHLQDCGLLYFQQTTYNLTDDTEQIKYQNLLLRVFKSEKASPKIPFKVATLTTAGAELYQITKTQLRMDYLRSFASFLRSKDCELSYSRIIRKLPDGGIEFYKNFDPIEPESEQTDGSAP